MFQIKCGSCGTVSDKETSVVASELYDIPKSKGSANLVQKVCPCWLYFNFKFRFTISNAFFCLLLSTYSQFTVFYLIFHFGFNFDELCAQCKFCDKVGNITVIGGRDKPYTLEDSESGKFVPIGCFDCRGIECIEFSFRDGWAAEGVRFPSLISDVPSTLSKVVYHTHIIRFYSNVTSLI